MPETVWIALITFLSGFLGVAVGAYANYKISSLGIKAERGKVLHDEKRAVYSELIGAYTELIETLAAVAKRDRSSDLTEVDSICRFHNAYAATLLLSSDRVKDKVMDLGSVVQDGTQERKIPKCGDEFDALLDAMREDLRSFNS